MKADNIDGLWFATHTNSDGSVCMGFAPSLLDAQLYCLELMLERRHERI